VAIDVASTATAGMICQLSQTLMVVEAPIKQFGAGRKLPICRRRDRAAGASGTKVKLATARS
jgi:hypothetical protein